MANVRRAGTVRFTVTVEQDAYDVLERYCNKLGVTKSTIINAWLVEATDNLNMILKTIAKVETGEMSLDELSELLGGLEQLLSAVGKMGKGGGEGRE